MKIIARSTKNDWVNFGTKDQYHQKPYTIQIGKTGKVYKIDHNGASKKLKSNENYYQDKYCKHGDWKAYDMEEKEARELYQQVAEKNNEIEYFPF